MSWRLFLDDEREAASGTDYVIVRSVERARELVAELGLPSCISFDHDLGDNVPTGFDFAKWLVTRDLDGFIDLTKNFEFYVHSQNPIGKSNIEGLLNAYINFKKQYGPV
jgi:hypothetical protein